jgi:hypothetical protein
MDGDKVGYGRPPKRTQWKKGQSGNPSGRPKGSASLGEDLKKELAEVIEVMEGGRRKRITKQRAAMKQVANKAARGDLKAFGLLTVLSARWIDPAAASSGPLIPSAADQKIVEDFIEREVQKRLAEARKDTP